MYDNDHIRCWEAQPELQQWPKADDDDGDNCYIDDEDDDDEGQR